MMTEENKASTDTDESRQVSRTLARAIWLSTQKTAGATDEPGSDEMRDAWNSAKPEMVRIANMTIRRLEAKNIELVQK